MLDIFIGLLITIGSTITALAIGFIKVYPF